MNEYLLLYSVAFVAILFAMLQDIRTREISNWVTFSLIIFVLTYRAFYSVYSNNVMFFIFGVVGILVFVVLGHLFYYSKVFAGGDAKLLFGLGGIFPYTSFNDFIYYGFEFILALFSLGAIYTLIYSLFLVNKNYEGFRFSFRKNIGKMKIHFVFALIVAIIFYSFSDFGTLLRIFLPLIILALPILFSYVGAIESSCMINLVSPDNLTEGDWLEKDVIVGKKIIKKSFNGLTYEQIILLRKAKKKVWIKSGIPFAPAFLFAFLLFLWYSSRQLF